MLEALRRGVRSWYVQVLLVLLIAAFALWGVADVFRGYGQGSLARVGKVEISADTFQQALQNEINLLSRQVGRRLTVDQARALGIDQRVMSRLIGTTALDISARQLGLSLPDTAIADAIRKDPNLQGPGGFNHEQFVELLRQNGITEQRYFAERRDTEIRDQLLETLTGKIPVPQLMIDTIHRYRDEARKVAYITLDPQKSAKVPEPDEAKLKAYYEQHKRQFVAPEYRKVPVLLLTRADVAKQITVAPEEVRGFYDKNKATFDVPERRHVFQLSFPDRAAADKARAELVKAKTFADGIKALNLKESDVDLGTVTRAQMIDPVIADAAFKLDKDKISEPVAGAFATVLLRVSEITPGKETTFDEVKAKIAADLANQRAARQIQEIRDKIDDARAGGKSLKELATETHAQFIEVAATDAKGLTPDGKPALAIPDAARVIASAFSSGAGGDREAVELSDGGYAWTDVAGVTPERQKPFDEVKDAVKTAWTAEEQRKALAAAAREIVVKIDKGATLDAIAKELGLTAQTTGDFKRTHPTSLLGRAAQQQAFGLAKGRAASVESLDGKSRSIIVVTDVTPAPPPTKEQTDQLRTELDRQLQTDVIAAYVNGLQERLGFSINQAEYRRVLGIDRQQ